MQRKKKLYKDQHMSNDILGTSIIKEYNAQLTFVDAETTSIDNHRNNQMTKENYTYHFNYILLGGSSQLNDPITYPVSARESLYFIQLIKIPDERGEKK